MEIVKTVAVALLVLVGAVGAMFLLTGLTGGPDIVPTIVGPVLLALALVVFLLGFHAAPQQEKWVIEVFGAYYRKAGPGLIWLFPLLERVRRRVSIWTRKLQLFSGEDRTSIDFKDGGSAKLKDTFAFIEANLPAAAPAAAAPAAAAPAAAAPAAAAPVPLVQPAPDPEAVHKITYAGEDTDTLVVKLLENACRSFFNGQTVDDALAGGQGGYNVAQKLGESSPSDLNGIREQMAGWGYRLLRLTVSDFDLDAVTMKAREAVLQAKKAQEAAAFEAERRSMETSGVVLQMLCKARGKEPKDIQKELDDDPKAREAFLELVQDLLHRRIAIDGKAFMDIRTPDAKGGAEATLLALLTAWRRMPGSGGTGGVATDARLEEAKRIAKEGFPPKT